MPPSTLDARTKFIQLAIQYGFIFLDGIPRWIETCTYEKYSLVRVDDVVFMSSIADNIGTDPSVDDTNWQNPLTFDFDIDAQNITANGIFEDSKGPIAPVGSIVLWVTSEIPLGWLALDGQSLLESEYPDLFDLWGHDFGTGSGSDTFNVPDMRESSPVGVGTRGVGVTAHDVFTVGQFKDDQSQGHSHVINGTVNSLTVGTAPKITLDGNDFNSDRNNIVSIKSDGVNGTPRIGTTTRGKRFGVFYIVKY